MEPINVVKTMGILGYGLGPQRTCEENKFGNHCRKANLQGTLLDVILNVSLFTVNFNLFTKNPAHSLYGEITCSHSFMQRPVHLSFG